MRLLRAETNDTTGANGGYPINANVLSTGFWPVTFAAQNATEFSLRRKHTWWFNEDGIPYYIYRYLFDFIDSSLGTHYLNYMLCANGHETWADVTDLASRRRYGVGRLTANVAAGSEAITVDVKHPALAAGAEKIFYANGTLTDNIRLDARSSPGIVDTSSFEEIICDSVLSVDGSIVTLHTATPILFDYAVGDKLQTYHDKIEQLLPSISNVVKTSIGTTTFDESLIVLYNTGTWEDTITVTMQDALGNYTVSSLRYGTLAGTGNKNSDFSATFPALALGVPQFKIPAGAIAGTNANGHTFSFETHMTGLHSWTQYFHPALAWTKKGWYPEVVLWEQ